MNGPELSSFFTRGPFVLTSSGEIGPPVRVALRPEVRCAAIVLALLISGVPGATGQSLGPSSAFCREQGRRAATLDTRGLAAVYCTTDPVLIRPLQAAHASARPVFYGVVPVAWGAALLLRENGGYSDVYRLALSQGATFGLVLAMKHTVGRPRPYMYRALASRSAQHSAASGRDAFTSFPSGHASLSAALVTSWTLSHPEWYVLGPGALWAAGVSLSRLYLGVHYPTDVLVGVGIGVGVGVLVHQLRGALTPQLVREGESPSLRSAAPISVRIRF